jgi:hypothetical protein
MDINQIDQIEPRSSAERKVLFGKMAITFAYDLELRRIIYEN